MLGYLTNMDNFVIAMFLMLVASVFVHQATFTLMTKAEGDVWPLRRLYARCLEFCGRVGIWPLVLALFSKSFLDSQTKSLQGIVLISLIVFLVIVVSKELAGLYSALQKAVAHIKNKIDHPITTHGTSKFELLIFNMYSYRVLSITLEPHKKYQRNLKASAMALQEQRLGSSTGGRNGSESSSSCAFEMAEKSQTSIPPRGVVYNGGGHGHGERKETKFPQADSDDEEGL